ncbi:MAG: hypothetical protein SV765_02205 [Pseudomonadota bacterium]|nr:hypothetical protein [Pseudomonadota bacterium]
MTTTTAAIHYSIAEPVFAGAKHPVMACVRFWRMVDGCGGERMN